MSEIVRMSKRIKKVRSNIGSDGQSIIISGNLQQVPTNVEKIEFDDDFDLVECSDESVDDKIHIDDVPCTPQDYKKANKICDEVYGLNLVDLFVKLLVNEDVDAKDFVIQNLAYKIQLLIRGASGVR